MVIYICHLYMSWLMNIYYPKPLDCLYRITKEVLAACHPVRLPITGWSWTHGTSLVRSVVTLVFFTHLQSYIILRYKKSEIEKITMAASIYPNFDVYIEQLRANPPINRRCFLRQVRFATITMLPGHGLDREYVLAAGCAIAWGWARRVTCPSCKADSQLGKCSRWNIQDQVRYVSMMT